MKLIKTYKTFVSGWKLGEGCPLCSKPIQDVSIGPHLSLRNCKQVRYESNCSFSELNNLVKSFLIRKRKLKKIERELKKQEKEEENCLKNKVGERYVFFGKKKTGNGQDDVEYSESESAHIASRVVGSFTFGGKIGRNLYLLGTMDNGEQCLIAANALRKSKEGRKLLSHWYRNKKKGDENKLTGLINLVCTSHNYFFSLFFSRFHSIFFFFSSLSF